LNLKNWKLNALIVGTLVLLTVIFSPASHAADQRLMVRVDEAFEVNGQVYESAQLTLRQRGAYNPTATINEIWVGNECLGMLLAREVASEHVSASDSFLFDRNAQGTLVLVGVTFRGERARELYQYSDSHDGRWTLPADPSSQNAIIASN
jgi:hypothetical protein